MKTCAIVLTFCTLVLSATCARADQFTVLGTASTYGVLGASTITSSGPTVVSGNLGLYNGTSVTGFLPGTVINGSMHITDRQAQTALADAQGAFNFLSGFAPTQTLTGQDLGGLTLGSGVYYFSTSAALNGSLTLDFQNANDANIIFLIGTTFTTSANSSMSVVHQGRNDNVYYVVGTSASLGANSVFAGDILADGSIGLGTGVRSECGSLAALLGAVTMLSNEINNCSSTGSNVTPYSVAIPPDPTPVPEPDTFAMLATGLLAGTGIFRRRLSSFCSNRIATAREFAWRK